MIRFNAEGLGQVYRGIVHGQAVHGSPQVQGIALSLTRWMEATELRQESLGKGDEM
jgi:hypothetical protein